MTATLVIFALVYLGMVLGELPGFALDRTGVALLGAIAIVAFGPNTVDAVWTAVDMPTLYLLFGMMVVSAQLRLAGFYSFITRRLVASERAPPILLALVVATAGVFSALLTNDIVCLAMAPILIEGATRRQLDPRPLLLGLACASNVGSAATLIGNPQNMLIGQALHLSFPQFLLEAGTPAILGLGVTWAVIAAQYRGRWHQAHPALTVEAPHLDRWQAGKGLLVVAVLTGAFLFEHTIPREGVALTCAGVLLLSRRTSSREMLSLIDWQLLVLFIGLFVVNDAFARAGLSGRAVNDLTAYGIDPRHPGTLFGLSVVLSNLVSNVPAVMLLLPYSTDPQAGPILALSSTFAGNLFVVGSIANIIVVSAARGLGVELSVRTHLRTGLPVTVITLAIAVGWLALRAP